MSDISKRIAQVEKEEPGFLNKLREVATKHGINPQHLLATLDVESSFVPHNVNQVSGATGILQFMPVTAEALGTTVADIKKMNRIQQLELVDKFFEWKGKGPYDTIGKVSAAVFGTGSKDTQGTTHEVRNKFLAERVGDLGGKVNPEDFKLPDNYSATGSSSNLSPLDRALARFREMSSGSYDYEKAQKDGKKEAMEATFKFLYPGKEMPEGWDVLGSNEDLKLSANEALKSLEDISRRYFENPMTRKREPQWFDKYMKEGMR